MNQTFYIRKKNWEKLELETDRSNLINQLLDVHYFGGAVSQATPKFQPPTEKNIKKLASGEAYALGNEAYQTGKMTTCKHGAHPRYCKHAKGGKPCKS